MKKKITGLLGLVLSLLVTVTAVAQPYKPPTPVDQNVVTNLQLQVLATNSLLTVRVDALNTLLAQCSNLMWRISNQTTNDSVLQTAKSNLLWVATQNQLSQSNLLVISSNLAWLASVNQTNSLVNQTNIRASIEASTNIALGKVEIVTDGMGTNALLSTSSTGGANNSGPLLILGMYLDRVTDTLRRWGGDVWLTHSNHSPITADNPLPVSSASVDFQSYQLLTCLTNAAATATIYALATNTVCTRDGQGGYVKYARLSSYTNGIVTLYFSTRPWTAPTLGAAWTNSPTGDGATNAFGYPVTISAYVTNYVNHTGGAMVDFPFQCTGTNRSIYTLIQYTDSTAKTNSVGSLNYTIGGMLD